MIIYKQWDEGRIASASMRACDGWFLFGVIPLYVRRKFG